MREYRGISTTDKAFGGGAYVTEHGFGHEMFNFRKEKDGYFGFVQPTGIGINVGRLTGVESATKAAGVMAFWVATHPTDGGTRVVGWYENATAYANGRRPKGLNRKLPDGKEAWVYVEAASARLLAVAERDFLLPRGKGGMGQSNVWYPTEEWASKLVAYATKFGSNAPQPLTLKATYVPHLQDTARRLEVEQAAMEATAAYYDARGYTVDDVANQNRGWDLECRKGPYLLRVEVKGTSAPWPSVCVEVTPNEYGKMTLPELRDSFRLAVVCVGDHASAVAVFSWSDETERWISETGAASLRVKEIVAARIEVVTDE
jgi:hypothetical protein